MLQLVKLELQKLISGWLPKIVIIIMCVFIGIIAFDSINSEIYFKGIKSSYGDGEDGELKGIEAIKERKAEMKKNEGYLDDKKIKDVLEYSKFRMKLIKNKENMDPKDWKEYGDMRYSIIKSFSKPREVNVFVIEEIDGEQATELYDKRAEVTEALLNEEYINPLFDQVDKELIIQKTKEMEKPLYFSYADGWKQIIENSYAINIVIILGICVMVMKIFTQDIHNEMALIVKSTVNGKKNLAISKILASCIFAIVTFIICTIIHSGIMFMAYGIDGWNCKIQIFRKYWFSIYNISFLQAFLITCIVAMSVCLFMVMITLMIANIVKRESLTLASVIALFIVPIAINISHLGKTLTNIVDILPIRALNTGMTFPQPWFCNIFGNHILKLYVVPIVMIILSIILVPVVICCYEKQKI